MNRLEKISQKIITTGELRAKRLSGKMAFTNGCFDILHKGHIYLLSRAADLGNYLVIGLNSDASVQRLKGPDRPVQEQESRALILASLEMVDFVVIFEEDTPLKLITELMPDVLVKGGDYKAEEIVGYKEVTSSGGVVKIIDFLEGNSSTDIISRMGK
ncbi:MAG: D-glycero-beta-D-manno-heptose 1-phosphate adenylyltransferase [Bacteroidales bacterium]|nr:D-glycero-beta-D-manno-heptose 1-phosphate adenylyltransferase [Bacteroidales bacterium]